MTNNELNYIDDWDLYFFKVANLIAMKSKDPSSQVGSVIIKDKHILTTGFNGFCMGVNDNKERYNNRELKYRLVAHSEFNACIIASKFGISLQNSTMYTQSIPCDSCAKAIIQSGVRTVKTLKNCEEIWGKFPNWSDSCEITKIMFEEAGISLEILDFICGDKIKIGGKIYEI